jgi:hypothetical protein
MVGGMITSAWPCLGQNHQGTGVQVLGIVQGVQEEYNDDLWSDG